MPNTVRLENYTYVFESYLKDFVAIDYKYEYYHLFSNPSDSEK